MHMKCPYYLFTIVYFLVSRVCSNTTRPVWEDYYKLPVAHTASHVAFTVVVRLLTTCT